MTDSTDSYYVSCAQCPRKCNADRSGLRTGFCGETEDVRIAVACLHFGEEPLVTVHGGSGTIFFTGCTLRCAFCQNYQISQQGMGRSVSSGEFTEICLRLQDAGAENINLVTGSHIIPRLAEYLRAARNAGVTIPYCWNTSAYENIEMLELLKDTVSVWLPDLKTLSHKLAGTLFDAADYPDVAESAILWMIKNFPPDISTKKVNGIEKEKMEQGVIIRHLFLPGRFEETADTLEWLKKHADGKAVISLMSQYTPVPFNEETENLEKRRQSLSAIANRLVNKTEDRDIRDLISAYDFDYLFYQDLSDDTSWLPDFNRTQPFSNALAKPFWHWTTGFLAQDAKHDAADADI
jgi:putative pyruvate formate lyase activating enzyme